MPTTTQLEDRVNSLNTSFSTSGYNYVQVNCCGDKKTRLPEWPVVGPSRVFPTVDDTQEIHPVVPPQEDVNMYRDILSLQTFSDFSKRTPLPQFPDVDIPAATVETQQYVPAAAPGESQQYIPTAAPDESPQYNPAAAPGEPHSNFSLLAGSQGTLPGNALLDRPLMKNDLVNKKVDDENGFDKSMKITNLVLMIILVILGFLLVTSIIILISKKN